MITRIRALLLLLLGLCLSFTVGAIDENPPTASPTQDITSGVKSIIGTYAYSSPTLPSFGTQPIVFLGDISNVFVEGAFDFSTEYLNLSSPQIMADLTSDIQDGPLTYTLRLPIDPGGVLTDVDNNGRQDVGVGVYTMNFTFNGIGDVFIDDREFIYYSSVTSSRDFETLYQINGGRVLVYAPISGQGFPTGYGPDGRLFTADDPIGPIGVGYTVVDITREPFQQDRSSQARMDIVESAGSEFTDFSNLSYVEAFDAMVEMMRKEYAFTELKGVDWDALVAEYRPRFQAAQADGDPMAYALAFRDFTWEIPDGHISSGTSAMLGELFTTQTDGGLGFAMRELDDGRIIINYIVTGAPADRAGIQLGAEVIAFNGVPIAEVVSAAQPWSAPFSTEHFKRLQQLRYATRFEVGTTVAVTYRNPDGAEATVSLRAVNERESFAFSSFNRGLTGFELPLDYRVLDSGFGYVKIYSFSDDNLLTLALWERAIRTFNAAEISGIILDMRQNGGGSPDIGNVMLGSFVERDTYVGTSAYYFPDLDRFEFNPLYNQVIQPSPEATRYRGEIAVLVGPNCASMCEFFTYALTLDDRAAVIGHYPTAGLGGGVKRFGMPEGLLAQFTVGRGVGADNQIHIEGKGVAPTIRVPVTEETLLYEGDVLLETAESHLRRQTQ